MEARFLAKTKLNEETGCLEWTGAIDRYGVFQLERQRRREYAHRYAWIQQRGDIPPGLQVLHSCDNPKCVNINHLSLGTHKENMRQMAERNRTRPQQGTLNFSAKLTEDNVIEIRTLRPFGFTYYELAYRFGVSYQLIEQVVNRKIWTHI
jgi:hypothetical protein